MNSGFQQCLRQSGRSIRFKNFTHTYQSNSNYFTKKDSKNVYNWPIPKNDWRTISNNKYSSFIDSLSIKQLSVSACSNPSDSISIQFDKFPFSKPKNRISFTLNRILNEFGTDKMSCLSNLCTTQNKFEGSIGANSQPKKEKYLGGDEPIFYKTPARVAKYTYVSSGVKGSCSNVNLISPEESQISMAKYSRFSSQMAMPCCPPPSFNACSPSLQFKRPACRSHPTINVDNEDCVACAITNDKYGKNKNKCNVVKKKKPPVKKRYFPVFNKRPPCSDGSTVFLKKHTCKPKKSKETNYQTKKSKSKASMMSCFCD